MRAIQLQLPNPRHVEVNRIFVKAKPDVAWQAARHFDASTIPWVRLLFDIRSMPDLVRERVPDQEDRRLGVDQVAESGEGFMVRVMNPLPALRARKNPWLALVLGFLFSGIALGIYFRSWIDPIVPTVIWLVLIVNPGDAGFWIGTVIRRALGLAESGEFQRETGSGQGAMRAP
jgi:hypothetical protein